jgi:hypothetical protein
MNVSLLSTTIASTVLVAALAVPASAFQLDGKLPMYPNAKMNAKIGDMPAGAIAQGVPLVLETNDSVHAVDAWYGSNAPKSCARLEQAGRVQYKCAGGSIVIYVHGSTEIALVPNSGLFHM